MSREYNGWNTREDYVWYLKTQVKWKEDVLNPKKAGLKPTDSNYLAELESQLISHKLILRGMGEGEKE